MVPEIVTNVIALAEYCELAKNVGVKIAIIASLMRREKILLPGVSFAIMLNPKNETSQTSTLCGQLSGQFATLLGIFLSLILGPCPQK
jgi:hypothetical protein